MSQTLFINSSYRNRIIDPNPFNFTIPFNNISLTSNLNVLNALNPICKSLPFFNTCWTNLSDNVFYIKTKIISGTALRPILDSSIKTLLNLDIKKKNKFYISQNSLALEDYLKNMSLEIIIDSKTYIRKIKSFNATTFQLELYDLLPFFDLTIGYYECSLLIPQKSKYLFIPGNIDHSKYNINENKIVLYNLTENQLLETKLEDNFVKIDNNNIDITDQIYLMKSKPMEKGKICLFPNKQYYLFLPSNLIWLSKITTNLVSESIFILKSKDEMEEDDFYFQQFQIKEIDYVSMEIKKYEIHKLGTQEIKKDVNYDVYIDSIKVSSVKILNISLNFCVDFEKKIKTNLIGNYFQPMIMTPQYKLDNGSLILQPNNTINKTNNLDTTLLDSQSSIGVSGITNVIDIFYDSKYIIEVQAFNDLSKLDFFAKNLSSIPGSFKGIDNFLIHKFSYEGVNSLNLTGNYNLNYNMTLSNLILPNLSISNIDGNLMSSYPYVFVEISNISQPMRTQNIINSNNPNAVKAHFICPLSDINNPQKSKFLNIYSGTCQNFQFSPMDSLQIKITLPNGEIIKTIEQDNIVPNEPNDNVNISLILQLNKI